MTRDDRIPDLLERVYLHALVVKEGGVESNRAGTYHCPKPGHEDRTPSFTVKDGRWKCWSACAAGGDAIDLLVWLRGMTKAEAIEELAARVGLERADAGPALPDRDQLVGWCRRRGWGPWVIDQLGLSLVEDAYGRPRVRFPFRLDGKVAGYQDRAISDAVKMRWLSPRGGKTLPYEADRLRLGWDRGHVFLLEGLPDVAAMVDVYKAPAVVGIPGAASWRPSWARAFAGLCVYVIGDNDNAGELFRARLADDLGPVARAVTQVRVPSQHNDVADWRKGLGADAFDDELMAAVEAVTGHRVEMAG